MTKVFNFMERSGELLKQGVPDEEAAAILTEEAENAEVTILDDGAWFSLLDQMFDEAEREYQAEIAGSEK